VEEATPIFREEGWGNKIYQHESLMPRLETGPRRDLKNVGYQDREFFRDLDSRTTLPVRSLV